MSLFDLTAIIEMAEGDKDFVYDFLQTFLENTPSTLSKLVQAWEKKDLEQVYMLSHKLKPAIDLARIDSLKEIIRFVEKQTKEGQIEGVEEKIIKIQQVLEQVFEEMREEL